jgi:hypothetical protein
MRDFKDVARNLKPSASLKEIRRLKSPGHVGGRGVAAVEAEYRTTEQVTTRKPAQVHFSQTRLTGC